MSYQFSSLDIQFIRSSLMTKTDEQLAELLEAPVAAIREKINELYSNGADYRQQMVLARNADIERKRQLKAAEEERKQERRRGREEERIRIDKEKRDRFSRDTMAEKRRRELSMREDRRVFATRKQNLDKKISVRIDSKTHIFVDPGADIEAIKKLYVRKPIGGE